MQIQKTILITGGAGFIGSHVVRRFVKQYPNYKIINCDKLTYAGNLYNLTDIEHLSNYVFERIDIADAGAVNRIFEQYQPDAIIHLAAESHVDKSIENPLGFVQTNVIGTCQLLNAARIYWKGNYDQKRFYQVSTDEVYGSLSDEGEFRETTAYQPHSPYAASKASADHFVRAFADTYGLDVVISNCSNNYGPYHFPEKLIPLTIQRILDKQSIPVYGSGSNVRDWLWVEDHARAIDLIFHKARTGETYNIGGNNQWKNIDLVQLLCKIMDEKLNRPEGSSASLITFVTDRAGHDYRYAIDATKLKNELGWEPEVTFEQGIALTVDWYLANQNWLNAILDGSYQLKNESFTQ